MATTEARGFSPEQQQAYQQIAGFFGRAEKESPAAAKQLVNVVGGLVGDQQTTQEKLRDGMKNIDVGLALIGDWLKETGAEGFEVVLGFGGGAKKAIGRSQVNFPTASDLIRVKGRVDPELQRQIPPLLSSFSRQIRSGLDVGLSPRQIVGGLVAESVGSKLSASGSANLRQALNKPLGGHFEWIREALKIPDVAEQSGFKPVSPPEAKPVVAPKPLPEAAKAGGEKTGLPAFLKEGELPEGYKRVNLVSPAREQLVRLDEMPGSETVCYVGRVGVRLRRKEGGKVFFSLLGFDLPKIIEHYKGPDLGLSTNIGPDGIPLAENELAVSLFNQDSYGSDEKNGLVKGSGLYNHINLFLPCTKDELGGVGSLSRFSFGISEGKIVITNNNYNDNVEIAVPVAAMAREGEVREGIEAVEDVLTAEERDFGAGLENFKKIEDRVGPVAVEELQRLFAETRSSFSKLPVGSRMRVEAMKGVIGQLGAEGEKLRNAGKKDEEIFGEWLMQVYIPLYRRTGKKS